jgi:hypothetical protein
MKKKKAPPPPPGVGGTKDHQQQSSLSLSSTDHDISEPHKKTTSLERHLSGKSSAVGSGHSPDKCSTLPGKMKMSEHDYRPVESSAKQSKITPETKTQSPEERCLDGDQKIPEVEEDTCVPDISKDIPLFLSQMYQDKHDIVTASQSSNRDVAEKQNECLEQLQVPTVETTPETPVEFVSKSKSSQVVDAGTPEGKTAIGKLEMDTCLPSPRGMWNLEEVSPVRCKGTVFSSFCDEASPLTSKCSADLRISSPFYGRYNDYWVKPCSSKLQTSETQTSDDVYDPTINSKCTGKTVQLINSAPSGDVSTKTTNCISEHELCNLMAPTAKINMNHLQYDISNKPNNTFSNKVMAYSSSNSRLKVLKCDPQKYQTITRSSRMTTQQTSECKVTACQKNKQGDDIHNYSDPKNVIHSAELNTQNYDESTAEGQPNPGIRVSLLVPPPSDFLISRGESSQSWNKFLQDLDKILENRAKFV